MKRSDYINRIKSILGPKFTAEYSDLGMSDSHVEESLNDSFAELTDILNDRKKIEIKWTGTATGKQVITDVLYANGWVKDVSNVINVELGAPSARRSWPLLRQGDWLITEVGNEIILNLYRYWPPINSTIFITFTLPYNSSSDDEKFNWPDRYFEGTCRLAAAKFAYTISAFYSTKENIRSGIDMINYENKGRDWRIWADNQLKQAYRVLNIPDDGIEPVSVFVSMRR